jgi:hypothetical protein
MYLILMIVRFLCDCFFPQPQAPLAVRKDGRLTVPVAVREEDFTPRQAKRPLSLIDWVRRLTGGTVRPRASQ